MCTDIYKNQNAPFLRVYDVQVQLFWPTSFRPIFGGPESRINWEWNPDSESNSGQEIFFYIGSLQKRCKMSQNGNVIIIGKYNLSYSRYSPCYRDLCKQH
jgi:hypothetical protein